jgi:hypothetical protein
MVILEQEVEELRTRLDRLEATVRQLVGEGDRADISTESENLESKQLVAGLQAKGLVRVPTSEERRLAAEWDVLSEEEKQTHLCFMHELVLDPPLSDVISENRR